jgi:8-hydroxy-5-deazaflavin:NADPH oxidoreductase
MKIAVIGNGHIGAGLARAWVKRGHGVVFGSREPGGAELSALCKEIGASAAAVAEAARGAEVVALAVPYGALEDVLRSAGDLSGKVVIDCTNAVEPGMRLKYGGTTSAAEELQKRLPGARVFKSFNAQGAENLARPVYGDVKATNFFCGDDAAGRAVMKQLVEDVGFEAVDAGPLANARMLEPLMLLWVTSSRAMGTRDLAFKLLRR